MKDYFDLTGQVAMVTGASSGLGVQFAKALANQGADIALVARREERLKDVKKEIEEEYKVKVDYYKCDLSEFDKIPSLVKEIEKDFEKIDILVNNAGVGDATPTVDLSDEGWLKVINLNLNAVFLVAREVSKIMLKNNYGRIINLASIHGSVAMNPFPVQAYASAKHGVVGLTKSLAAEFAKENITVNAIGPGYFKSEMTEDIIETDEFKKVLGAYCPTGRAGEPDELSTTVIYLASKYSTFTNGQTITVDGGWIAI